LERGELNTGFLTGKPDGKKHFEEPSVDGRIILIWSSGSGMERMDWIHLPQDRDGWRALVNEVMNIRVP